MICHFQKLLHNNTGMSGRSVDCTLSVLSRSDGSAKFAQGDTSVIGNACGPFEQKTTKDLADKLNISVSLKSKTGSPPASYKFIEKFIQKLCESTVLVKTYASRTSISVVLQEIYDDGSFLACCVNAACATLLDACIHMKCQFAAVNVAIYPDDVVVVDPTRCQESEAKGCITFIYNKELKLLAMFSKGLYSKNEYELCTEKSKVHALTIFKTFLSSFSS